MKSLTPADRRLVADLIEIRHGMEAMHQAIYGGLPDPDVEARLDRFAGALDVIRRRVPNQLLDQQTSTDHTCVDCNHSHEAHRTWAFPTRCLWCECTRNYPTTTRPNTNPNPTQNPSHPPPPPTTPLPSPVRVGSSPVGQIVPAGDPGPWRAQSHPHRGGVGVTRNGTSTRAENDRARL